jgi:flagellar FliL protein
MEANMAKDDQAPAEVETGGSKKKLFIIIGAGVAVALILGVVAFMFMGKGDKKGAAKEGAKVEGKAAEGAHGAAPAGKEGAAAATIYTFDPAFIVNIFDGQETRYLKVKVEMEMAGATKAELDARLPQMKDAIIVLLSAKTLRDVQDVQGKNQLKEEILVSINKVVAPSKVAKIYFTEFVVQ